LEFAHSALEFRELRGVFFGELVQLPAELGIPNV
jgi:hypothetical protein